MSACIFENGKYFVGDQEYERVTQILNIVSKPALYFWYGKNGTAKCKQILDEAATLGTGVHNILERLGKGETVSYFSSPVAKRAHDDLKVWLKQNKVEIMNTEHRIHHTKYHYAGTCDGIVKIDGKIVMIDYKTSSACYDTYALQLAAYKNAFENMNIGVKVDRCLVLRFEKDMSKKNSFDVYEVNDLDYQWESFKHALYLYRWEKSKGKLSKIK